MLNEIELDILESIDKGLLNNAIDSGVLDKNGENAYESIHRLSNKGLIKLQPSGTGLGEHYVLGLTEKGQQAIKK